MKLEMPGTELREMLRKVRFAAAKDSTREVLGGVLMEIEGGKVAMRAAALAGAGYRIVLAKTQEELRAEGKRMCNCVGMGHYGEGIVLGDRLIVMLRHGNGRSYCDIEIDRRSWKVVQCYLRRNEAAPEEVQSLARRIAGTLRSACARMRRKTDARKRSAA